MAHMLDETEEEERRIRLRSSVLKEVLESEAKYIQDLYTLMIYYITPLKSTSRFPEISANPKADVKMLFSTIELIYDGNNELLENLKAEYDTSNPMVGKTFVKMVDKLCQYYGVFCNHQKDAMDTISSCMKSSPPFKAFLDQCAQKPETNNLSLLDYLVKPFQRLLKYPLLLRELLKLTPESHPDRQNITAAIDKLQLEVDKINKDKAKSDNMRKMLEISQSLEGVPRGIIYLHKLQLEDIPESFSFKVIRHDKNLTYVFYGKTKQEKETWLHEIKMQQAKIGVNFNKERKATVKKDVMRVYLNETTFKSFAVTPSTSVSDVCDECSKKLKREGVGNTIVNYKLALVLGGEVNRQLESSEKILDVAQNLEKDSIKLEFSEGNYILAQEITADSS